MHARISADALPFALSPQSAQQSQGIQTLLEAEKEAAKIVAKARTCECLPRSWKGTREWKQSAALSEKVGMLSERCSKQGLSWAE